MLFFLQAEDKTNSEVRKFLTAFFETIKNHKDSSSLFADNAHINDAGNVVIFKIFSLDMEM